MARTDNLNNYLTDVATAIKNKKGDSTPIQASSFDTEIANLPSGGLDLPVTLSFGYTNSPTDMSFLAGADYSARTDYSFMFYYASGITTIPQFIMNAEAENYESMFNNCTSLTSVPTLNLAKAKTCISMFNSCQELTSVTISKLGSETNTGVRCNNFFNNCKKLTNVTIGDSKIYFAGSMFNNCSSLITLPEINTSVCKSMSNICANCTQLQNVPVFNMAAITYYSNFQSMFTNCPALTDTSLNNILASLATTSDTGTTNKTLKYIGLNQTQATTCTTLSNWAALSNAGWTTGY